MVQITSKSRQADASGQQSARMAAARMHGERASGEMKCSFSHTTHAALDVRSVCLRGWGSKNKPQLTTFSCTAEPKHFSFVSLTHWLTSAAMSSTQVMIHQHIAAEIECGERVQRESRESARS